MPQEIKLKLAIDPRDVQTLRKSSILRELALKRTPRRSLVSVYYDTPSHSLARRGIMLRVRKMGSGRVQCVKMNAGATSSFRRTEIESPIRGNRPDLMQIPDLDVRRMVQKRCARRGLARVFATNVKRETRLLQLGRTQIECAIDRGVIVCERKRRRFPKLSLSSSRESLHEFMSSHIVSTLLFRCGSKPGVKRPAAMISSSMPSSPPQSAGRLS